MSLDTGTTGILMLCSGFIHLAIVYVFGTFLTKPSSKIGLIILIIIASFILQSIFLTVMQVLSCGGVKNVRGIFAGVGASTGITALMTALPVYIEGLRLTVSEGYAALFGGLFGIQGHRPLMTPRDIADAQAIADAAVKVVSTSGAGAGSIEEVVQKIGLNEEQYATQTMIEIIRGASFMTGFAGAYGVGVGSFYAGSCSSSSKD